LLSVAPVSLMPWVSFCVLTSIDYAPQQPAPTVGPENIS
jgi:hypothetical protein